VEVGRVVRATSGSNTEITLILPLQPLAAPFTYPGAMFEMGIEDLDLDYLATAKHFHLSSLFLHRKLFRISPTIQGNEATRTDTPSIPTTIQKTSGTACLRMSCHS